MINLQNCKSQTPVESYIISSVVHYLPPSLPHQRRWGHLRRLSNSGTNKALKSSGLRVDAERHSVSFLLFQNELVNDFCGENKHHTTHANSQAWEQWILGLTLVSIWTAFPSGLVKSNTHTSSLRQSSVELSWNQDNRCCWMQANPPQVALQGLEIPPVGGVKQCINLRVPLLGWHYKWALLNCW